MFKRLLVSRRFAVSIMIPSIVAVLLIILTLFFTLLPAFENALMERKNDQVKELINSAYSILVDYEGSVTRGTTSLLEAQESAASRIGALRYGDENKDYFWVNDMQPVMVVHPYRQDLIGKDLSSFEDKSGKFLFVEIVRVAREQGHGFLEYMWQWKDDETRIVPKLSYVKLFEPWNWVIGTGIYIEDVKQEISLITRRFTIIGLIITLIVLITLSYIGNKSFLAEKKRIKLKRTLDETTEKFRSIIEFTAEGSALVIDGKLVFSNKQLRDLLGYHDQFPLPGQFADIFVDGEANKKIIEVLTGNHPLPASTFQFEGVVMNRDCKPIDVLVNVSRVVIEEREGYIFNFIDLKLIEQIRGELVKSNNEFQSLASLFDIGVFRVTAGRHGFFMEANEATLKLFHFKSVQEAQNYRWVDFVSDYTVRKQLTRDMLDNGQVRDKELRVRIKGVNLFVKLSLAGCRDDEGKLIYIDGIIEDHTFKRKKDKEFSDKLDAMQSTRFLLEQNIASLMQKPLELDMGSSVKEAIQLMKKANRSEVFICSDNDELIGLVTNTDLRNRVLLTGASLSEPVYKYMTSPVTTIPEDSRVFDFIDKLVEHDIARLAIVNKNQQPTGMLSVKAIPFLQRLTPLWLHAEVSKARSVNELREKFNRLPELVDKLLKINSNVQGIIHTIAEFSDSVSNKVVEIIFNEIGEAPLPFTIIALGSQGRFEQTLATDQDNALIFQSTGKNQDSNEAGYLKIFSEKYNDFLNQAGYNLCKGGYMIRNGNWRKSLHDWKLSYTNWIVNPNPTELMEAMIFFDLRPVFGDRVISDQIVKHIHGAVENQNPFFYNLVYNSTLSEPQSPFGFFGGTRKEQIDLKKMVRQLASYARIKALKNGVSETGTIPRLKTLLNNEIINNREFNELSNIFDFLFKIRLRHQVNQLNDHIAPDNIVPFTELTHEEISHVKEIHGTLNGYMQSLTFEFKIKD